MTDNKKTNIDFLKKKFFDSDSKLEITGAAELTSNQAGVTTAISVTFTIPSGFNIPKQSTWVVLVPDGFSIAAPVDWFLFIVGQSSGTWSPSQILGPEDTPFSKNTWSTWSVNTNSLDAPNHEFNINVDGIVNPGVAGQTGEFQIWINGTGDTRLTVTCPGAVITS